MSEDNTLYIFIDESGNFDFSRSGTQHFVISGLITLHPNRHISEIKKLHLDIVAGNRLPRISQKYLEEKLCHKFHASEDKQLVRDLFYELIKGMEKFKTHTIVVRKYRTNPSLRNPLKFYPKMIGYLIGYLNKKYSFHKLIILIDGNPTGVKKRAYIKSVKKAVAENCGDIEYKIYFPSSASHPLLQVVDYINWAIYIKWEREEFRPYSEIKEKMIKKEFDIFSPGDMDYY